VDVLSDVSTGTGENVAVVVPSPDAVAPIVADTRVAPVKFSAATSLELRSLPAGGVSLPDVRTLVAPLVSLLLSCTGDA
jgi:hypothetical protein